MARPEDIDRSEPVDIEFTKIAHHTSSSILFEIEGTETWIGNGAIENLDEIKDHIIEEGDLDYVTVPLWLAVENGWREWEDG